MQDLKQILIAQTQDKVRLDVYLTSVLEDWTRSQIKKQIDEGRVLINGKKSKAGKLVANGDAIELDLIANPDINNVEPENIPLDIVFEDSDLLVVNKPAGMTVHPAPGAYHGTLVNALLYHCRDNLSGIGGVKRPGIVHRIDKETSGLLVVAKNDLAHQGLSEQFFEHSVERTYYAVVYNVPSPLSGTIVGNIGRSRFDRKKMALLKNGGKNAVTHYKTLETFNHSAALVQCNLETGRTHQIRVHLSSIGCGLIGDKIYKQSHKASLKFPTEIKRFLDVFPRQALHAATLGFIHPRNGKKMKFEVGFPEDFGELVRILHNS